MKKNKITLLIILVAACLIAGITYMEWHKSLSLKIDPNDVEGITVLASNGAKSINVSKISDYVRIVEDLESVSFYKTHRVAGKFKSQYGLTIYKLGGGYSYHIYIISSDTVVFNGWEYEARSGSIDVDFIKSLYDEYTAY